MENKIFKIMRNDIFNRYMVANRFIKQGELILKESPLIVGTQLEGGYICFKCSAFLSKCQIQICEYCNFAIVCGKNCKGKFHTQKECDEFFKLNLDPSILKDNDQIITPLRFLLIKNYSEESWKQMNMLESHLEARRNSPIWNSSKILVEDVLSDANVISQDDIKDETVQKICGILDVNSFEIRPPQAELEVMRGFEVKSLRGLYVKAALMAHDCVANAHLAVDDDFVLYIHASVNIEEGSPIFFNYSNAMLGNQERKKHLKEGKYFECTCKRCLDPSEFNTNISSLKCHKCKNGKIQPKNMQDANGNWSCISCHHEFTHYLIESTLRQARNLIQDTDSTNIVEIEKLHAKLLQTLHPQHYLLLELQQNLLGLYTQDIPSRRQLSRKIQVCQNILKVSEVLEPGISRIQGVTLYELHSAVANLAYKEYSLKEIGLEKLLQNLLISEGTLKAALKHLIYEPKNSPEGHLVQNAFSYLKALRESICDTEKQLTENHVDRKTTKPKKKK